MHARPPVSVLALSAGLAGLVALAAGCAPRERAHHGGTVTLALRDSFATLDPALAWDPALTPYLRLLYEGLVAFDDSGRVVPACADEWQVQDGGRVLLFRLRPGLVAGDGKPVTADDFKRGFQRLFRPGALRSPFAPQFVALEGARTQGRRGGAPLGIDVPDARTLVLRLDWPDPNLLEKLAQARSIVPAGEDEAPRPNGAYRLERERGAYAFVRNPAYTKALAGTDPRRLRAGALDTIRVLTGVPARRALLGLESGRIDLLWPVPVEYRERLLRSAKFAHVESALDPPLTWWLVLNCELAPLARRDARRGVALSVHRPSLPEAFGPWLAPVRAFTPGGTALAPGYDPGQARMAFESARYFTGVRAAISIPRATSLSSALDAIAPAMARGGVQVDPVALPRADWERGVAVRRGVAAALVPWQPTSRDGLDDLAARLLNRGFEAGWGGNWSWYHPGAALDSLLLRGLRESDPVTRASIRDQVGRLLESDLPFVPLATGREAAIHQKALADVRFHPRDGLDLRVVRRTGPRAAP